MSFRGNGGRRKWGVKKEKCGGRRWGTQCESHDGCPGFFQKTQKLAVHVMGILDDI